MPIMYFGSKISENMVMTPEGYLICKNVPIGRTGSMQYLGEELGLEEKRGKVIKVVRTPEELFSKMTIASFEGKPLTNDHPSKNLDINTVAALQKGHIENVRPEGDYLVADLHVRDNWLINEIQENGKREVSCGYDCLWVPTDDSNEIFEQRDIVGNHVAVVKSGRAGSRVAIKDSGEQLKEGRKVKMPKKISKSFLAALGFKTFAADADPEDVAKAMDALNEEDEVKDAFPDGEEKEGNDSAAEIISAIRDLGDVVSAFDARISELEKGKKPAKDDAASVFDGLEKELEGQDSDEDDEVKDDAEVIETKDSDEEEGKPAADSLSKIVHDMKSIIMAIPDEKTRLATAKAFAKTVRDARGTTAQGNGYGVIAQTVFGNKKGAMDSFAARQTTMSEASAKAAEAWNKMNAHVQGGK